VQTVIPLTSSTGFPPSGLIQIGSEQIRYATVTGNDLEGVTRGVNGTICLPRTCLVRRSTAQR
jgi:hypothetical protein